MMRARSPISRLAMLAACFAAALVARSEPGVAPRDRPGVPDREARLAALDPARPIDYFELAEEIAYESTSEGDTRLARELFVLAYELDRRAGSANSLGPSVCLALRDLSINPEEKIWLAAMSGLGSSPAEVPGAPEAPEVQSSAPFAEAVLLATIHFVAQEPRAAQELLRRVDVAPGIAALRVRHPILARVVDETGQATVCPECRNRRVASNSIDAAVPARPCSTCGGNPGPRLGEREYVALLRLETELAGVEPVTWSADFLLHGATPIRDADPGALAAYFNIDPTRTKWRFTATGNGEWCTPDQP